MFFFKSAICDVPMWTDILSRYMTTPPSRCSFCPLREHLVCVSFQTCGRSNNITASFKQRAKYTVFCYNLQFIYFFRKEKDIDFAACVLPCDSIQRGEERARARAAGAQEGDHPHPALCRRHRPGRPGQHALPGLLQRQEQTAQRPALGRVSDWRGEVEQRRRRKNRGDGFQQHRGVGNKGSMTTMTGATEEKGRGADSVFAGGLGFISFFLPGFYETPVRLSL